MVQPKQTKRRFSPEFKLEAIELVVKYQQSAAEVARALELDPSPLRKWIRQYKAEKQVYMTSGVDMIHHLINFLCGDEVGISTKRKSDFKYVADLLIFSEEYKHITTIDICRESPYYYYR